MTSSSPIQRILGEPTPPASSPRRLTAGRALQEVDHHKFGWRNRTPSQQLAEDNKAKATWKETVSGFEKKNNIAIYGLHLDYQCFENTTTPKADCAPKKIMISKHPLFIRPFGGSDVADFEAPSPKDLMRIWTIGEGNKLLNALPLALKGQGFDCRFLWAALKLAQRSFRTAQGKAKPGVKQVLNIKGGKVTTATRAKHRWLNGLKAKKSQKPGTLASFEGDYDDVFVGCCFSDDEEE